MKKTHSKTISREKKLLQKTRNNNELCNFWPNNQMTNGKRGKKVQQKLAVKSGIIN